MAGKEDYDCSGTLFYPSDSDFDAEQDVRTLEKGMKGAGTDEQAIIDILGQRCQTQRLAIAKLYKTMYGKDLHDQLKSELSGHFEDLCIALVTPPDVYDADQLRKAMKGMGTDEATLTQIICTRPSKELAQIKETFSKKHKRNLEKDVVSETSGFYKRCLVSLLQCNRSESEEIDQDKLEQDVNDLYEAGAGKWGTDESQFNLIMCARSFPYLRALFDRYEQRTGKTILQVIKSEMSGNVEDAMLTIAHCAVEKPHYYARLLNKTMKGLGTKDDQLCRCIINRCEIDMVQIKEVFEEEYGKTLASFIDGDTSGDYKRLLLTLIGEKDYCS